MYTNEFVESLVRQIDCTDEVYLKEKALNIAFCLDKDKTYYYDFGPYWWAVKDCLRKYYNKPDKGEKWYCRDVDEPLMKMRAWHGSLFKTVLAGLYRNTNVFFRSNVCSWDDKDGESHSYTLFDDNAGV
jgi:hypothetical protein